MEFKLNINMDNIAFDDEKEVELARILNVIASKIKNLGVGSGKVFDINGNSVGSFEIIED